MCDVLIIDADRQSRSALADWLERRGLSTLSAETCEQAHHCLAHDTPALLITDAVLPGGGAIDLITDLPTDNQIDIVVTTADHNLRHSLDRLASRHIACMNKPLGPEQLEPLVKQVLRRHSRPLTDTGQSQSPAPIPAPDNNHDAHHDQDDHCDNILGRCPAMRKVYDMIARVAPTDASVLLDGESGTGKELVAQAIHQRSDRRAKPCLAVNCGAIPEKLIESELFGHEKGAYTGADRSRQGVFERAAGGTLFLDEITEMHADMQVRLLRVLETGLLRRVGGEREINIDLRVIAATNRDPAQAVQQGILRDDLMYRLAVFPISLPPLRDRGEDILLLAQHFLDDFNRRHTRTGKPRQLTDDARRRLVDYHWPGNVRQLRNVVHRAVIMADDAIDLATLDMLTPLDSRPRPRPNPADQPADPTDNHTTATPTSDDTPRITIDVGASIADAERALIFATLDHCQGDKPRAANILGISLKTLYNRLNTYATNQPPPETKAPTPPTPPAQGNPTDPPPRERLQASTHTRW